MINKKIFCRRCVYYKKDSSIFTNVNRFYCEELSVSMISEQIDSKFISYPNNHNRDYPNYNNNCPLFVKKSIINHIKRLIKKYSYLIKIYYN